MIKKNENGAGGCFAALVILVIGVPLASILYAWAAMLNWNWFVTTLGVPRIGFFQAYALQWRLQYGRAIEVAGTVPGVLDLAALKQ